MHRGIRFRVKRFTVSAIDEHRRADTGLHARLDVLPAVADDRASRKVVTRLAQQQTRLRLPARTPVSVVVITHAELVDRQLRAQSGIDRLHSVARLRAARDVGLIGHDDEAITGRFQARERVLDVGQHAELVDSRRRKRFAVADDSRVQDAVAIEKDCRRPGFAGLLSGRPRRHRLPLGGRRLQRRMRDQQVPDDGLKLLGVRRDRCGIHRRYDDARVGDPRGVPAVAADDPEDRAADASCELERLHQILADVALGAAAADREHEHGVLAAQTAFEQPRGEHRVPAFVVRARRQLRHVVGRRVGFEPRELAKIVDGVRGVRGAAADAEQEQPAAARPDERQRRGEALDGVRVERGGDPRGVVEIAARKSRHSFASPHSMSHSRPIVRSTSTAFFTRNALLSPRARSVRSIGTSTNVRVRRSALTRTSA